MSLDQDFEEKSGNAKFAAICHSVCSFWLGSFVYWTTLHFNLLFSVALCTFIRSWSSSRLSAAL